MCTVYLTFFAYRPTSPLQNARVNLLIVVPYELIFPQCDHIHVRRSVWHLDLHMHTLARARARTHTKREIASRSKVTCHTTITRHVSPRPTHARAGSDSFFFFVYSPPSPAIANRVQEQSIKVWNVDCCLLYTRLPCGECPDNGNAAWTDAVMPTHNSCCRHRRDRQRTFFVQ